MKYVVIHQWSTFIEMINFRGIKRISLILVVTFIALPARAQFVDGATGLLMMPSAEMQESGSFMISNSFLNKAYVENPMRDEIYWGYNTFSYGFSITVFSRIEIVYVCTLLNHNWSPYAKSYRANVMFNQDRHFAARVQALKEGEFGWKWMPSIVLGLSDPVTGGDGGYSEVGETSNGFFNRFYIAASKHFNTPVGVFGAHAAYQYTRRKYIIPKGFCAGVTWNPVWLNRSDSFLSSFRVIAEYDAKEVNVGLTASIWKDHFEFWTCLQGCQHFNGGVRFKVVLAGTK